MKTSLLRFSLAASVAALTACDTMYPHQNDVPLNRPMGSNRYLQDASTPQQPIAENPDALEQPTSTDTPPISTPPIIDTTSSTPSTLPAPPAPTSQYPYGKPVPGKKGFVMSPYDDKAGMIDVRDYSPGTKVRDPYTNKIFLVP